MACTYLKNLEQELIQFIENPSDVYRDDNAEFNKRQIYRDLYGLIPSYNIIHKLINKINKDLNIDTTTNQNNETIHQIINGDKKFTITSNTLIYLAVLICDDLLNDQLDYVSTELLKEHKTYFVLRWLRVKSNDYRLLQKLIETDRCEVTFDDHTYLIDENSSLELIVDYYHSRKITMFSVNQKSARS